jgi:hypothetical protein
MKMMKNWQNLLKPTALEGAYLVLGFSFPSFAHLTYPPINSFCFCFM